jgi:hypothetical protein
MSTPKEEVRRILENIPEDASFEDIQYHIYVREKVEKALKDVEQGNLIDQDEVEKRMARWLGK